MSDKELEANSVDAVVEVLVALHGLRFGNRSSGKYRISRKYFRQISARRKLTPEFVGAVTDEIFEKGFVLIDLETHFVLMKQALFNSFRRVTDRAIALISSADGIKDLVETSDEIDDSESADVTH